MNASPRPLAAVLLAAGKGVRLGEGLRKPARTMAGLPLVRWVLNAALAAGADPAIVVAPAEEDGGGPVHEAVQPEAKIVLQRSPHGTGHAFLQARPFLQTWKGDILVLVGDAPAITRDLLQGLLAFHREREAAITFASGEYTPPPPYGRVLRSEDGVVRGIVEEREATATQRAIREVVTSQFVFRGELIWPLMERVKPSPVTGEVQLTDVITIAGRSALPIEAWRCPEPERLLGVNTPEEWALMERLLDTDRDRIRAEKG